MENSAVDTIERKSMGFNKFSGILIAGLIVLTVYLLPAIPAWVAIIAAYPMLTSVIDIYLERAG